MTEKFLNEKWIDEQIKKPGNKQYKHSNCVKNSKIFNIEFIL